MLQYRYKKVNNLTEIPSVSGIYYIEIESKGYVGSTQNLKVRLQSHINGLRSGKHHSKYLQNAYNKYLYYNLYILCTCPISYLLKVEQIFLDSQNIDTSYCMRKIADRNTGFKHSDATKEKFRQIMQDPDKKDRIGTLYRGKKKTKEQIEKVASQLRGKKQSQLSNEKRKLSWELFKQTDQYEAWRLSMRDINKGKVLSEKQREEIRKRMTGRKPSEETKAKMSNSRKNSIYKPKGYRNKNRLLQDDIVLKIKEDIKKGLKNKLICESYNIPLYLLIDIKRNRSYKEIEITNI